MWNAPHRFMLWTVSSHTVMLFGESVHPLEGGALLLEAGYLGGLWGWQSNVFQSWSLPACLDIPVALHYARHGLSQFCYHAFLVMIHTKNMSHMNPSSLRSLLSVVQEEKGSTVALVDKGFISFRCRLAMPQEWNGPLPRSWKQTTIDSSNSKAIPHLRQMTVSLCSDRWSTKRNCPRGV